jgi:hypothetical protein
MKQSPLCSDSIGSMSQELDPFHYLLQSFQISDCRSCFSLCDWIGMVVNGYVHDLVLILQRQMSFNYNLFHHGDDPIAPSSVVKCSHTSFGMLVPRYRAS